jgi:divalent metal cation (Fe/Co/Zn/Cd) transporter
VAAVLAAGVIGWNGGRVLRRAADELMDTVPDPQLPARIGAVARTVDGVAGIEKCRLRKAGQHVFVELHVEVDPAMPVSCAHTLAHEVKDRVRAQLPVVRDVLVHVEPVRAAG